jgi:zinc finger protein
MRKGEPEKAIRSTTDEQNELLAKAAAYAKRDETDKTITAQGMNFGETMDSKENKGGVYDKEEAITFPDQCYACTAEGEVRMCVATIPFFKEIIIMCFKCDSCGNKSTEIKQGGGISERATTITFDVLNPVDLNRDVFKSDSCEVKIPEIELELMPGTLGSVYTTVEGLLDKILTHL